MAAIPEYFNTSITITALSFALVTWLLIHIAIKKSTPAKKHFKYSAIAFSSLTAWFLIVYFTAKASVFAQNPFVAPFIMIGFILLFAILQKVYNSKTAQLIMTAIPQHWIIGIQTYRIVGYSFLTLAALGFLPWLFAYSAGYGDMIVGLLAPIIALLIYFKKDSPIVKKAAIYWNYFGILDLIAAIGIGMLGYPRPVQTLPLEVSTEQLSLFPLALIPLFVVPLAFMLHLFSLKGLKSNISKSPCV